MTVENWDPGWIAFGAAIAGATFGGLASGLGAWLLSRSEHRRQQRVELLTAELPALEALLRDCPARHLPDEVIEKAFAVAHRAIAARSEAKFGYRIAAEVHAYRIGTTMVESDGQGGAPLSDEGAERVEKAISSLRQTTGELTGHLRRRLGRSWWELRYRLGRRKRRKERYPGATPG